MEKSTESGFCRHTRGEEYFDIVIGDEELLSSPSALEEAFYLKDLKQRKLFLNSEIEQAPVADLVHHILQYNMDDYGLPADQRKPILLYIASPGGFSDDGFELIDVILSSKTPVYTINLAYEYSMGLLIGLAGHKRFAMKNAKFLMHDGDHYIKNSATKAQDQMEFCKRIDLRTKEYVLSRSNISPEEYDAKQRVEWFMFAEEAKEKGFVDYIIGIDCGIDCITGAECDVDGGK